MKLRYHRLHLREELLALGLLFGCSHLMVRKAELFAAYQPSTGLRLRPHYPHRWTGSLRISLGKLLVFAEQLTGVVHFYCMVADI